MNTSAPYPPASRTTWARVATLFAAAATATMLIASIFAEAANRGWIVQSRAPADRAAACQAAADATLPLRVQSELQGQCAGQVEP